MKQNLFYSWTILLIVLSTHYVLVSQVTSRRILKEDFPKILNTEKGFQIPVISIKPFDLEEIKKEDAIEDKLGHPPRFGRSRKVDIGLTSGIWSTSNLGKHWKIGITSEGAKGFMLVFDEFFLPEGSEVYIYNSQKTVLIGAITHDNNNKLQRYSSDLIGGDTIVLELLESPRAFGQSRLHIESVLYAYSIPLSLNTDDAPSSILGCHRDVRCGEGTGWENQSSAVAMIFDPFQGRWCSGTLLNNACNNLRPTLLTAFHCADFNANRVLEGFERT